MQAKSGKKIEAIKPAKPEPEFIADEADPGNVAKVKAKQIDSKKGKYAQTKAPPFTNTNVVCVCTKAWWQNKSGTQQNQVIIHEMGHKIGMVSDASGSLPDKTTTFYDDSKGHVGPHCHHGIPAGQTLCDSAADAKKSDCVMYGATNGHAAFYEHCSVTAKSRILTLAGQHCDGCELTYVAL